MLEYIKQLRNESFEGWSDDAKNGYLTALKSVEERFTSTNTTRNEILRCITYIDNHLSAGNLDMARKWCNEVRAILSPVA